MVRKEEIKKLTVELDGLRSDGANKSEKIKELHREVAQLRNVAKTSHLVPTVRFFGLIISSSNNPVTTPKVLS